MNGSPDVTGAQLRAQLQQRETTAIRLLHDAYSVAQVAERTGLPEESVRALMRDFPGGRSGQPAPGASRGPITELPVRVLTEHPDNIRHHPTVHISGPMIHGLQHCLICRVVLADESRVTDTSHVAGGRRYARGGRVVVLRVADDVVIQGPFLDGDPLPAKTRPCTPTSEKSLR